QGRRGCPRIRAGGHGRVPGVDLCRPGHHRSGRGASGVLGATRGADRVPHWQPVPRSRRCWRFLTMPWQPAPIIYPDVELVVTQRLRAALPLTVQYVGRSVPRPRKDVMVTVDRDGGASAQLRDRARLRVRCWDLTDIDVATLARRVVATMAALP